ncbi:MAG: cobalamin-binding protein [Endomicrobiales bacterium]|nr:cobalamin-binding protein [Endomicrobiales bacterium]
MMRTFKTFFCFLAAIFILACSCFAETPKRIVALAPSISKSLALLGLEGRVVGVTTYCPDCYSKTEKIGTVLEPNVEKIVSLKPDLVVASREGNRLGPVEKIRQLGIEVYVMGSVDSYEQICGEFGKLAEFLGESKKADEIVERSRARLAALSGKTAGAERPRVFWQIGARPMFSASAGSFINDIIAFAGGTNIMEDLKARHPQVSLEEVVKRNPEVIILVSMGAESGEVLENWKKLPEISAVRNERVYFVDSALFGEPTPDSIAEGAEKIFKLLHGR